MDKKIKKCTMYRDCNGDPFYIETTEEPVYIQREELLAPLDFTPTMNANKYKNTKVVEGLYSIKKKLYIHLEYPFKIGDIFKIMYMNSRKYFIVRKLYNLSTYRNFVYEIKRLDGNAFDSTDYKTLKSGIAVRVTGFVKNKTK